MKERHSLGQIVFSKCGRDKGRPFVVISIEEEYVHLIDGDLRKVDSPKLKKKKHVQPTNTTLQWIKKKTIEGTPINDSDIRKGIDEYLNKTSIE
ncbi:MAG: KOW domain-containing RNA-binding protein [Cellulosilyticaceae bacterium]